MNKQLMRWFKRFLRQWGSALLIGFVFGCCGCLMMQQVLYHSHIIGTSMDFTLRNDEQAIGIKLKWMNSELNRGDIISFRPPIDDTSVYVKRIIGLPGETIFIDNGCIYVNGSSVPLEESYLTEDWMINNGPYLFEVPEGKYMVLGDNRNDSFDSREWDIPYVSRENIDAKLYVVCWPLSDFQYLYK